MIFLLFPYWIFLYYSKIMNPLQSKKSLAPPRRDARDLRPTVLHNKKNSPKNATSISKEKILPAPHREVTEKPLTSSYQQKYRNKNLNSIPTPLLITISGLNILDISFNRLNDSQIELIMNSCTKLLTLCIQGNINTIIPASIWKLKQLKNFKHDWLYFIENVDQYEPEQRLRKLKSSVQKPELVVKVNRIVGMDFEVYSRQIAHITIDNHLHQKVQKSDINNIGKQAIYKYIKEIQNAKNKARPKTKPIMEKDQFLASVAICGFEAGRNRNVQKPGSVIQRKQNNITKQLSQAQTDAGSKHIKIEDIRDLSQKQSRQLTSSTVLKSEKQTLYTSPGMPLHQIMGNFDCNSSSPSEIDALLLKGYNPNQYDANGMSPYHICLIRNQKKGFDYLINISANNPGFFDLQMPSQKQCRDILHYSVFLKNYQVLKQLVQFGIPTTKRDGAGHRLIHLVDQNYEFLILLKKLLRKTTAAARSQNALTVIQTKKKYTKHPQRNKQQSKFRITYSKNDKLLQMYQSAVTIPGMKKPAF